jgi:hypothetical protein
MAICKADSISNHPGREFGLLINMLIMPGSREKKGCGVSIALYERRYTVLIAASSLKVRG